MAGRITYYGGVINKGLILYLYALNKNSYIDSDIVFKDLTKNKNNGNLLNGPILDEDKLSISFDGINQYCDCSSSLSIINTDQGTFSVIAKLTSTSSGKGLASLRVDSNNNIEIFTSGTDMVLKYKGGGVTKSVTTPQTISEYVFYDLTYDVNDDELKAYINGSQIGVTTTGLGTFAGALTTLNLASTIPLSSREIPADIGQFRIYNRALSSSEILQNYNALKGRFGLT